MADPKSTPDAKPEHVEHQIVADKTESAHVDGVQEFVPAAPRSGEYYVTYPAGIAVLVDEGKDKEATRLVLPVGAALPKGVSVDEIDRLTAVGYIAAKG
jgi:hypothetical protein